MAFCVGRVHCYGFFSFSKHWVSRGSCPRFSQFVFFFFISFLDFKKPSALEQNEGLVSR